MESFMINNQPILEEEVLVRGSENDEQPRKNLRGARAASVHRSPQGDLVQYSTPARVPDSIIAEPSSFILPEQLQGKLPAEMEAELVKMQNQKNSLEIQANPEESEQNEGGDRWRFSEEIVETLNEREEGRLEQRYSRGLLGRLHHKLGNALENNKGLKIAGKVLLGGAAVAGAVALGGTAGMIAAPLLFSMGAKIGFSGLIEGVQEVTVLGGARRELNQRKDAFKEHARLEVQEMWQQFSHLQAGDISPDQFFTTATSILIGLEQEEQGVKAAEDANIALEAKHKKIRGLASTGASIALGIFGGVPLGIQHFHGLPDLVAAKAAAAHHGLAGAVNATAAGQTPHEVLFRAGDMLQNGPHSAFQFLYDRASEHVGKVPLHVHNLLGIQSHDLGHLPPTEAFAGLGLGMAGLIAKTAEELLHSSKGVGKDTLINTLKGLDARRKATQNAPGINGFVAETDHSSKNILNPDVARLGGFSNNDPLAPSYLLVLERLIKEGKVPQSQEMAPESISVSRGLKDSQVDERVTDDILMDVEGEKVANNELVTIPKSGNLVPINVPKPEAPINQENEEHLDKFEYLIIAAIYGFDQKFNPIGDIDVKGMLELEDGNQPSNIKKIVRALAILDREDGKPGDEARTTRMRILHEQLNELRIANKQKPSEQRATENSEDEEAAENEQSKSGKSLDKLVTPEETTKSIEEFLRGNTAEEARYLQKIHNMAFGEWKNLPVGNNFLIYAQRGNIKEVLAETERIRSDNPNANIKVMIAAENQAEERAIAATPEYKALLDPKSRILNVNSKLFVQKTPDLSKYMRDVEESKTYEKKNIELKFIS